MKIGITIFIFFLAFMIIGSFGGIHSYYLATKDILAKRINNHLQSVVQSRANHIEDFLEEHKHMVELLAYLTKDSDINKIIQIHPEFYEVFVLDENGKVTATTNPKEEIGTDFSKELFFLNGKERTYIQDAFYDEEFGINSIAISSPAFNGGVFVTRMATQVLDGITLNRTGLEQTGEVYLVNRNDYMLTSSRFLEDTFLKQKIGTLALRHCFEEHAQKEHLMARVYEDYRGKTVLGSHVGIPEMRWCLVAEIDEAEAIGKLNNELLKSALIILIIISVIMIFFIFLSDYFIRGIVKQAKITKK